MSVAIVLDDRFFYLAGRQRNVYSQFGEDGLIEAVFERVGETNRFCFEVGAANGVYLSNTKRLLDAGWRALLIEKDAATFEQLRQLASDRIHTINDAIGPDSLDLHLADCGAPDDPDFGCIDIDGQDYWAWDGMRRFKPRVMLVEFAYAGDVNFLPELGGKGQAGLNRIIALGKAKGYIPAAMTDCNVLFVRKTVC